MHAVKTEQIKATAEAAVPLQRATALGKKPEENLTGPASTFVVMCFSLPFGRFRNAFEDQQMVQADYRPNREEEAREACSPTSETGSLLCLLAM